MAAKSISRAKSSPERRFLKNLCGQARKKEKMEMEMEKEKPSLRVASCELRETCKKPAKLSKQAAQK